MRRPVCIAIEAISEGRKDNEDAKTTAAGMWTNQNQFKFY